MNDRTVFDVADLVGELAGVDRMPAVTLVIDKSDSDGMPYAWEHACQTLAGITVTPRFLSEDWPVVAGVLAHEVAHHRPGTEYDDTGDRILRAAQTFSAAATLLSVVAGVGLRVVAMYVAATVVGWCARRVWRLRCSRREELTADAYAVLLLDAVGLPGRDYTRAALEHLAKDGRALDRWLLPFSTHPTAAQRLAALDKTPLLNHPETASGRRPHRRPEASTRSLPEQENRS